MLSGVRPFDRPTPIATALAHLQDPPPPLPASAGKSLSSVVLACLAKNPADRPSSAREIIEALRPGGTGGRALSGCLPIPKPVAAVTAPPPPQAPRVLLAASLVALVVVICLAAMLL